MTWYLNGRSGRGANGGIGRYRHELLTRIPDFEVIEPPPYCRDRISDRLWEQVRLTGHTDDGVLASLANTGPTSHPRHLVVVHDLLPLTHPETVGRAFAALQRRLLPAVIGGATTIVTVSDTVRRQIIDTFCVAADQVVMAPPGVSAVFRPRDRAASKTALGLDPDRPLVAALASSVPRKRSGLVVDVLAEVHCRHPGAQVLVAGQDGASRVFGRQGRPDHRTVPDRGALDDDDLAHLYAAADVFVALSSAEGFGLPVVEAASSGAAVVTTPVPSVVEHADDAVALVADASAAIVEVTALLGEPARRAELAAAAAIRLRPLTWDATASALRAALIDLESSP
ncbi:MAG: glycosyltransferase [Actinomycetota bacterium]